MLDAAAFEPLPGQSVVFVTSRFRYLGLFRWLTLVAPFADQVEAALEERIVGGRRGSGQGEDGGGEGCAWFDRRVFGVGFGWAGWHRGKNEVVGIGELPSVVGGGADEIAADADSVFLGVEIDAGEPELAVGGAGVGAVGGGDVEVGNGKAFGIDEGAGGWVRGVEMPGADQGRRRAEGDLKVVPADGHEDGPDNEEDNGKDDLGD